MREGGDSLITPLAVTPSGCFNDREERKRWRLSAITPLTSAKQINKHRGGRVPLLFPNERERRALRQLVRFLWSCHVERNVKHK